MTLSRAVSVLCVAAALSACSGAAGEKKASPGATATTTASSEPTETVVTIPGGKYTLDSDFGANVTKAEFGPTWPLTIKSGRVNCVRTGNGNVAVVFTSDDEQRYAVNGIARNQIPDMGYLELDPIWAPDPKIKDAKMDISVFIDICKPLMR